MPGHGVIVGLELSCLTLALHISSLEYSPTVLRTETGSFRYNYIEICLHIFSLRPYHIMLFTRCIIAFIMIVFMRIYRDRQRRGCGTEVGKTRWGFRRRDTGNEGRWKRDRAMEGGREGEAQTVLLLTSTSRMRSQFECSFLIRKPSQQIEHCCG